MNLPTVAASLLITTGLASYSTLQLQNTLDAVQSTEYQPLEIVSKKTSLKEAIEIVKRNNSKRQEVIFNLNEALKNSSNDVQP